MNSRDSCSPAAVRRRREGSPLVSNGRTGDRTGLGMFQRVPYYELNKRQRENYNFQKVAARMADYGFNCLRLTDDWQGADFIACHVDGETFLKVQLKGRMTIDWKYLGKGIHIAFLWDEDCYVYDHDALVRHVEENGLGVTKTVSWSERGHYNWPNLPRWAREFLSGYRI